MNLRVFYLTRRGLSDGYDCYYAQGGMAGRDKKVCKMW